MAQLDISPAFVEAAYVVALSTRARPCSAPCSILGRPPPASADAPSSLRGHDSVPRVLEDDGTGSVEIRRVSHR